MSVTPIIKHRIPQSYVAVPAHLPGTELASAVPALFAELHEWLESHHVLATGAPFIRYLVVDYNSGMLDIEVGIPASGTMPSDQRIQDGVIPGGRFASVLPCGPYDGLAGTTAALLEWGKENSVNWQVAEVSQVTTWGARIGYYLTNPAEEPDPECWKTEIAILLAEPPTG